MEEHLVELVLDGLTHGGEAVGRLPDGKACFVPYAIPGERVRVAVVEQHRRWARARLVAVVEPSRDRVDPPCPYFGPDACGGCQLQHVAPVRQAAMKRRVVVEQLQRIGRIPSPPVSETVRVGDFGYRNRARFGVSAEGRLGFRRASSHAIVPIDRCLLLAPATQALREEAGDRWPGVAEVSVRAGLASGDHALVVRPGRGGLPPLPAGDAAVALLDDAGNAVALRGDPTVVEQVAGTAFRVSPTSFFQANPVGAEALVTLVRQAAAVTPGDVAVDLFAGVGLFSRALAADGARVIAVEAHGPACADARANLPADVDVVHDSAAAAIARLTADGARVDVVVLDPPRRGAGPELSIAIAGLAPRGIVYVSCDPAALARDARTLTDAGYPLALAVPVDQFAQTAQIEVVAVFRPVGVPAPRR